MHESGILSPNNTQDPRQNLKVREILRILIGCSEDWELENTGKSRKIETPFRCIEDKERIYYIYSYL